jgi:hypothetical protein
VDVECGHCGCESEQNVGPWLCPACGCCYTLFEDGEVKAGYYREVDVEWVTD